MNLSINSEQNQEKIDQLNKELKNWSVIQKLIQNLHFNQSQQQDYDQQKKEIYIKVFINHNKKFSDPISQNYTNITNTKSQAFNEKHQFISNSNLNPKDNSESTYSKNNNNLDLSPNILVNEQHHSSIWINLDDENSILKMNSRVCSKSNIKLNLCKTGSEFINMLKVIYKTFQVDSQSCNTLYVLSDHMLDNELGHDVISQALQMYNTWELKLNIVYVLLSSSEEKSTLVKQQNLNVISEFVLKPLNKSKLEILLSNLTLNNIDNLKTTSKRSISDQIEQDVKKYGKLKNE